MVTDGFRATKNSLAEDLLALRSRDWLTIDNAISPEEHRRWLAHAQAMRADGRFRRAGIGSDRLVEARVRGDETCWVDGKESIEHEILDFLETVRASLNRLLFIGAEAVESHFAFYPPGSHYDRHVDNAHKSNRRLISAVLYLSEAWQKGDGGELRIYPRGESPHEIAPCPRRLVLFVSEDLPHEVLLSRVERWSITAWFGR